MSTILVVCTANVCRSPLAERILQHELDQSAPGAFIVRSGGLQVAPRGMPIDPRSATAIADYGAQTSHFTPRAVGRQELVDADVILAMTRAQRSALVEMLPTAHSHTFTLPELARVASRTVSEGGDKPAHRLTHLVQHASLNRGSYAPHDAREDDVVDPYGMSDTMHAHMVEKVQGAVRSISAYLAGPRHSDRSPS